MNVDKPHKPSNPHKPSKPNKLTIALFALYAALLVGVVIFKLPFHAGMGGERVFNLMPLAGSFDDYGNFLWYEVAGNILAFVPLGIYLPALRRDWPLRRRLLVIVCVSLTFEALQFIFAIGWSDITDVLSNTLGGLIGIAIFALLAGLLKRRATRVVNLCALPLTACVLVLVGFIYFGVGFGGHLGALGENRGGLALGLAPNMAPEGASGMAPELAPEAAEAEAEATGAAADADTDAPQGTLLVSAAQPLPDGYQPPPLVALNRRSGFAGGGILVAAEIEQPLRTMLSDARDAGATGVFVTSGYRSREEQAALYAEATDKSYVQPAGASEHETGLAVDLSLPDEASEQWLADNCWRYGFIVRYPAGKEPITGISNEPWHFRYVGQAIARICHEQDLCLEEYVWLYE